MRTNFTSIYLIVAFLIVSSANAQVHRARNRSQTSAAATTIETGKLRFYELKQTRGEENYMIRRLANGELEIQVKTEMPFAEQEKKPLINASLRTKADLTPLSFEIKGLTLLDIQENTSIVLRGNTAAVHDRGRTRNAAVSSTFFTMSGYVPVTIETMLIRYWLTHGRPTSIPLLPVGEVFVEFRGEDTFAISGKTTTLSRYHLSGNNWRGGWGRHTIWLDSENRLAAVVNLGSDIETNLYAFGDGYETATTVFLKRAVQDAIDRYSQIADRLSPQTPGPIALVGATLIDLKGNTPIENSTVVIDGDRIVSAGPRSTVPVPSNAKVIDVSGKFILPGLWDMHSHFYQPEFGPAYLAAGITTARDVGNDIEFGTALRDAAKAKRGLGPRMFLAGYIDGKNKYHSFDVQVETAEEARAAVQHYHDAGYEQIKIRNNVKLETLKAICTEAHRLGMTVTGHVPDGMNALQAVEAGMDQVNHLIYALTGFFPKRALNNPPVTINLNASNVTYAIRFFKEHGTVIDPTEAVLEMALRPMNMPVVSFEPAFAKVPSELTVQLNKKGAPAEEAEGLRMVGDVFLKIIFALHRAGVPIVAGTDVGVPGHTLHRELELYVKAGMTPLEAIQTATTTPARVMKVENEVGTIEPGKRADLIVLDANPLTNISNIRKVSLVMTQGRLFESGKLWQVVGFKP